MMVRLYRYSFLHYLEKICVCVCVHIYMQVCSRYVHVETR